MGSVHTFSIPLDGNGLIPRFGSANANGRDNPDDCSIHYNIPLDEYDFDDSCFLYPQDLVSKLDHPDL